MINASLAYNLKKLQRLCPYDWVREVLVNITLEKLSNKSLLLAPALHIFTFIYALIALVGIVGNACTSEFRGYDEVLHNIDFSLCHSTLATTTRQVNNDFVSVQPRLLRSHVAGCRHSIRRLHFV